MDTKITSALGAAIREPAEAIYAHIYDETDIDGVDMRTAYELLLCLARVIERGHLNRAAICEAMGAPGDWGYDDPIGKSLLDVYTAKDEQCQA